MSRPLRRLLCCFLAVLLCGLTSSVTAQQQHPRDESKSLALSPSYTGTFACSLFQLYFGVPHFSTVNISLKQAAANQIFDLPLFMTLLAHYEDGELIFDISAASNTFFVADPAALTAAVRVVTGSSIISIPHVRRREKWVRESVATWEVRPPRDMLDNVGIAVDVDFSAFSCTLTWGDAVPVGHVLLGRRYENSQIFFVRGMLTLGDVVAFLTAASSVSMVAHALQRSHILALWFHCEIADDYWFDSLLHPLQFEVGAYYGSRARGALVGNICFMIAIATVMMMLAFGLTMWRRRKDKKWTWARCFTVPPPPVSYKVIPLHRRVSVIARDYIAFFIPRKSRAVVRWPGIMFIPLSFVTMGTARASTELIRRHLSAGDVVLALLGYILLIVGFVWALRILQVTPRFTVSFVVSVPEKDTKLITRFDRFCEYVRYQSFRFTTSAASWFSRKRLPSEDPHEAAVNALLRNGGGLDAAFMADRSPSSSSSSINGTELLNKRFVDEYGSIFDAYHTMGYYWGLCGDMVVGFIIGVLCACRPALRSKACAVNQLLMAIALSLHLAVGLWMRPWSTLHNRFFAAAFGFCTVAMIAVNLFGLYTNDDQLQHRVDTLDLINNGIALIKLFFDMVSLLLLPSLGGFFGYLFGSSSYRQMRQHAWAAEMQRREKEKKLAEDAEKDEEEEEEEEDEEDNKADDANDDAPNKAAKPQEEQNDDDDDESAAVKKKPNVKYRIVRKTQIIKTRLLRPPAATPIATPEGSDNDDTVAAAPVAVAAANDDDDEEPHADDEEEAEEEMEERPAVAAAAPRRVAFSSPPSVVAASESSSRGLSTLDKFKMI